MKSVKCDISYPLVHIFNQSFVHGIVPDQMKIANVMHIHKKVTTAILATTDQFLYYLPFPK